MTALGMTVIGVPQTIAMFAATAGRGEVAAEVAAGVLAEEIAAIARTLAPVAEEDGGQLRDSITVAGTDVFVEVPYAGFVEYGTVNMEAQPYLRPACDEVGMGRSAPVVAGILAL